MPARLNPPPMTATARRERILQLLQARGYMAIDDLVAQFQVTPQTLRADLNHLANEGRLVRHHGGASMPSSVANTAYALRRADGAHDKARIAQTLAQWLPDRCSLFMTPGTTMLAVAQALHGRQGLKVITNHLEAAQALALHPGCEVVVLGGVLQPRNGSVGGTSTLAAADGYRADLCLFSVGGIDADGSLLEFHESDADLTRRMLQRARRHVLVADHGKFGRAASVRVGSLREMAAVATDRPLPPPWRRLLRGSAVQVLLPDG